MIVNGGALCIRTEAARRVGGFDPNLGYAEDLEFWCRLAVLSDFVPIDDVVLEYRLRRAGANWTLAGTPFRPNVEALEVIFAAPALRERFTERELRRYRRLAEINEHWLAARNALTAGRLVRFAQYLLAGLLRYPDSVFQWRLIYLFLRNLTLAARLTTISHEHAQERDHLFCRTRRRSPHRAAVHIDLHAASVACRIRCVRADRIRCHNDLCGNHAVVDFLARPLLTRVP